jgi:hypothetical protein
VNNRIGREAERPVEDPSRRDEIDPSMPKPNVPEEDDPEIKDSKAQAT